MRRRVLLAGLASLTAPRRAARAASPRRLSILLAVAPTPEYEASLAAFEKAMAARGWRKDDTLTIDLHWAVGDPKNRSSAIAAALATKPDVVLVQSEAVTTALRQTGGSVPVVFVHVADPVGIGLVDGLARPGGRLTGFSNTTPTLAAKWLQLLHEVSPGTKRASMLFNPKTAASRVFLDPFLAAAPALGFEARAAEVGSAADIETALTALAQTGDSSFVAIPDPFLASQSRHIVELAARLRLPAIYPYRYYAAQGGLVAYGVDNVALFRQSADYVDRVLRGESPAELPVQQPTRLSLVVNVAAARALGLALSPAFVAEADEVIE